ncbi:hypothetical protein CYMTET_10057 [Cymbomonas tetramitiformis]|uniref:DUF6817 domain-containing protein n=1 Tax=Cymbomonas tetramitiformis TaxID=36881 RepID=A0AAE0GPT5_9CHLO|nr:hypothetical protein CYMTET_10057 [Cymbomonas tetramitiformis]
MPKGTVDNPYQPHTRGFSSADILDELLLSKPYSMPHTNFRSLPDHLLGVARQLQAWKQPPYIRAAGLCHSMYSTEMYPWALRKFSQRKWLSALIGEYAEQVVYMYCTVSQYRVFREARRLAQLDCAIPMAGGFRVYNCHTGQVRFLSPGFAAELLLILAADLMEQDPFFDTWLVFSLLKLAAPHLKHPPPLYQLLEEKGFYKCSQREVRDIERDAKRVIKRLRGHGNPPDEIIAELQRLVVECPWLVELKLLLCRKLELAPVERLQVLTQCQIDFQKWGTAWSSIIDSEAINAECRAEIDKTKLS